MGHHSTWTVGALTGVCALLVMTSWTWKRHCKEPILELLTSIGNFIWCTPWSTAREECVFLGVLGVSSCMCMY